MENPTLDLIHRHTSVRHYKSDPLPEGWIDEIVSAGQCASTSSNLQAYSVIAVTDPGLREKVSVLAADQAFIREAPLFLLWCADLSRLERVCNRRGYSHSSETFDAFLTAAMDAALAAQNAALAAEALGLGICYIGALRDNLQGVIDLFELPRLVAPVFGMTVGFPAKPARVKPRLPLPAMLHWNRYDTAQEEESLRAYDAAMAATGIYQGRQVPVPGKPDVMEDYGWTEHVARRVCKPFRLHVRSVLEKQGFALK